MFRSDLRAAVSAFVLVLGIPALLAADENSLLLRYGMKNGKQYAFEIKIQAELDDEDQIREGVITYSVASAKDSQFVVHPSGNLAPRTIPHPGAAPMGIPMMGPPRFPGGPRFGFGIGAGPQGITFNRQGEMLVASQELTPLPFLLGDVELIPFEELAADATNSTWEKHRDVQVVEHESGGPFPRFMFGGPRSTDGKHTTAREQINYSVVKRNGDTVEISKTYSLRTNPEENSPSRFDMTGQGQFSFDLAAGVIKSFSMKYEVQENEKNSTHKIPITVTFHVLTDEELALRHKKAEEARIAAEEAAKPKPFQPGERQRLLRELRSADSHQVQTAANTLAKRLVDDRPAEVAKALAMLLRQPDEWIQGAAAKALEVWATPEVENNLIAATKSDNLWVRNSCILALGKIKSAKAAQAVAAQMHRSRGEAANALKAMGPIAEDATLGCLKDRDFWVQRETCNVLAEIGGAKSEKALQKLLQDSNRSISQEAQNAIAAIQRRTGSQGDSAAEDQDAPAADARPAAEKPAEKEAQSDALRTWTSKGGKHSIKAKLLSVEGNKAVLQKQNGSQLKIDIDKLSEKDRKYIEDFNREENPFEP
jgi:HEAT repeat protein